MQSTVGLRLLLQQTSHRLPHTHATSFSSKTPIKSSLGAAARPTSVTQGAPFPYTYQEYPSSQGLNLVSPQQEKNKSPVVAATTSSTALIKRQPRLKRKEILRMEESELEGYALLEKKLPLLERRGEASTYSLLKLGDGASKSYPDYFSFFHGDWDLRPHVLKRWWASLDTEIELKQQAINPARQKVLGYDLSVAHFVVARKGKIRFRDHTDWVTEYRIDAKPGVDELDLPVISHAICSLPTHYDPRYRVEAIDCTGLPLMYEGLGNFLNLNYVKWLSFKNTPFIDDWCLDRITRLFYENLEYIDLSGCTRVSERGIGALVKCKNLKTLVVENLPHAKNLEMVTAMLEDQLPGLVVIGVDYEKKMEQLRIEGEEIERKLLKAAEELEANTITIEEPTSAAPSDTEQRRNEGVSNR